MSVAKIPTKSLELYLENWREHCETGCHVSFLVTPEDLDYFRLATLKKGKIAGQRYACVLVELGPDEQPVPEPKPEPAKAPKPESKEAKAAREQAEFNAKTGDLLVAIPPGSEPAGVAFEKQADGSFARTIPADDGKAVVAAIKGEVGAVNGTTIHESKHHGFPEGLCGLAVRWSTDAHFQTWLSDTFPVYWDASGNVKPAEKARAAVCGICGIDSRKELDTDEAAGNTFRLSILDPYAKRRAADEVDEHAEMDEDDSSPDTEALDGEPPF